ncbi:MAG: ABC transporter permease [Chloroflexi bacterium]|nr:ABC transporter permease [Chloroflexota bacterium]
MAKPDRNSSVSSGQALVSPLQHIIDLFSMPALAILTAFVLGALVIWITSGQLETVGQAYGGLVRGAFIKQRGFSESLVATVPYIFLSLGLALGFKAGLFNIGVEGQFYIGAISAAWAGQAVSGLPAIIHLPLTLLAGAIGGAIWAGIPGYLKAKTGAHEVISTMMMNYVAFRLAEFLISGPLRAQGGSSTIQTPRISPEAELWSLWDIPNRLADPLNALGVALLLGFLAWVIARAIQGRRQTANGKLQTDGAQDAIRSTQYAVRSTQLVTRYSSLVIGVAVALVAFVALPPLTRLWWPFGDQYDRLHIGVFLAVLAAVFVWWLLWKTTIGFELRTVGANPNAARYAGINITRNVVLAMAISGALAGIAGTVEVLGVSICRCLPLFFSSGYGFDSIAIALLGRNNPFGILASAFLFGAMRNGADLMELTSGVSKYIISLIQALVLLFVAAPAVVRWIYRIRRRAEDEGPLTRGWGG